MARTIYLADDEENIREVVKAFLESEGYEVTAFEDGDALLEAFRVAPADLVILDVMMPGSSGFEICRELRKISTVPIIMLTARDSDLDYATGINLGSDDYFTKPFSAMALVLRVKAIFRRIDYEAGRSAQDVLTFADLVIDQRTKTVTAQGKPLDLTPNEFNLLAYLVEHQERAVSREELLNKVWGFDSPVETRAADDTVRRLRKKIQDTDTVVETVWGFGFRLKRRDGRG
ncbi:MAG: response regulator transcription factor [Bacillota bacterium]|jgi:DNA-binding response OmpR family regulator